MGAGAVNEALVGGLGVLERDIRRGARLRWLECTGERRRERDRERLLVYDLDLERDLYDRELRRLLRELDEYERCRRRCRDLDRDRRRERDRRDLDRDRDRDRDRDLRLCLRLSRSSALSALRCAFSLSFCL